MILKLSDAFSEDPEPDIEVKVTMININYGHNRELMGACRPLNEYSWIVEEIRINGKGENMTIEQAVDKALEDMPDDFVIKPFLMANRAEVKHMCITEYDEERTFAAMRREEREIGREEGIAEGIAKGKSEGKAEERKSLIAKFRAAGVSEDMIQNVLSMQ